MRIEYTIKFHKKITTFAIFIALMIVGGYILTFTSKSIPIPCNNFIVMSPYLTLVMILMLVSYPRFGTLSMINLVFRLLMVIFSPWMTLAIIISGVLADFTLLLPLEAKYYSSTSTSINNLSICFFIIYEINKYHYMTSR
jgi:hypothetical protein